jgi:hypothetical protein
MTGPATAIYNHFENVTDPRINRGANHSLLEMMFVALTAAICGANGWVDVERFAKAGKHPRVLTAEAKSGQVMYTLQREKP